MWARKCKRKRSSESNNKINVNDDVVIIFIINNKNNNDKKIRGRQSDARPHSCHPQYPTRTLTGLLACSRRRSSSP